MHAPVFRALALFAVTIAAAFAFAGPSPLASAGGGACHQAPTREGTGTEVRLTRNCFSPSVLRVEAGTDVTFHNDDQVNHQLSSIPGEQPGESGLVAGQVATRTFMDPGIYPYFCNLHYGMVGAIVVGDGKFVGTAAGRAEQVAVQARPQAEARPQPEPAVVALSADDNGEGNSPWPLYAGLGVAIAGLMAGTTIAVRARR